MKINQESLDLLLQRYACDDTITDLIADTLDTFIAYYVAIYEMESVVRLSRIKNMSAGFYKELYTRADNTRHMKHNSVIANIGSLNRLAEQVRIPLIYGGTVSNEAPFRREIADAVIAYVEMIIRERA